jgi:hypothetical protein
MWKFGRHHHTYHTIPKGAEKAILKLAKQYPRLSQNGLQDEVERMGVHADPHELKLLLREHGHYIEFRQHERRPGQWDTGWPTWSYTNAADRMEWPEEEPYEYRFPYWGWMSKQPLWYRLLVVSLSPLFLFPAVVVIVLLVRLVQNLPLPPWP